MDHADNRPIVGPGTQNDDASATKEVTPPSNVSLNAEESAGNSHCHRDDNISLAPTIASRCFGAGFETSSTITRRSRTPIGEAEMQANRRPSVHSAHSNVAAAVSGKHVQNQDITILDEDQIYWDNQLKYYQEKQDFGPEISSTIAGAAKVFWQKNMSEERLKNTGVIQGA